MKPVRVKRPTDIFVFRFKALWRKKWTKLRLGKMYGRIRLPTLNCAFDLLYMQGLSVQNTRGLERTGQELSSGMS